MEIRTSREDDLEQLDALLLQAFGVEEGPEIVQLVRGLLLDPGAQPRLSLVAAEEGAVVGHILFTRVTIPGAAVSAQILCPLAVLPRYARRGIGGRLIGEGLRRLRTAEVELVFVLGHPDYYPRSGFHPAGVHGLDAPYPILPENADAWMVQELRDGVIGRVQGTVQCCDALDRPEYWVE